MRAIFLIGATMDENPYSDGKIRSHADAIIRAIVTAMAALAAWNAPYAWYWRIGIFVLIMFLVGIIYPAVQLAISRRRSRTENSK
jgi:hypothetical protein